MVTIVILQADGEQSPPILIFLWGTAKIHQFEERLVALTNFKMEIYKACLSPCLLPSPTKSNHSPNLPITKSRLVPRERILGIFRCYSSRPSSSSSSSEWSKHEEKNALLNNQNSQKYQISQHCVNCHAVHNNTRNTRNTKTVRRVENVFTF